MKRLFIIAFVGVVGFGCFVLGGEFVYFYLVLQKVPESAAVDLIVVFGGSHARIVTGYALANQGLAPFMIISPASVERLKYFDGTYRTKARYRYLVEKRAETTFQNARLVAQLIRSHGLDSVLLVTSDYHMPRSILLLNLQLMGSGVAVRAHPVEVGSFDCNPLAWAGLQKKRVYNEMIELWGSLAEMVHFYMTGRLPEKGIKRNKAVALLRSVLLFDIREH